MLTLAILRHAKSSWDDASRSDYERPLNARGNNAAPEAGMTLRELGFKPSLVLCSPAKRTRETLDRVLPELRGDKPQILYEENLYHAGAAPLLERLRGIPPHHQSALLVGHNPGLHALALTLAGTGDGGKLALLSERFPTAAIAHLSFDADLWAAIGPEQGHLTEFWTPRRLRD